MSEAATQITLEQFDEKQKLAVERALDISRRIAAVTGPAGSGKTTIMRTIYEKLRENGYNPVLAAPTGKAARRIREATGAPAMTIHALLQYTAPRDINPRTGKPYGTTLPRRTRENPIEYDTVIADEYAMVNQELMAIRRRMGMLFQFGALFTDMSVFENVAFPLREHTHLSEEVLRDLVLMKLNAVGLRGARDLMPSQISGGMARRVALARAIALDPPLIMYDEPFAGLDPISLGITARLIKDMNQALGATSILVTHDIPETFEIADYVYFIANGKIAAEGTPADLEASSDPFVKQFVSANPDGPVPFHYPGASLSEDFGGRV